MPLELGLKILSVRGINGLGPSFSEWKIREH